MNSQSAEEIKHRVRQVYGQVARQAGAPQAGATCCGPVQEAPCCGQAIETSCCGPAESPASTGSDASLRTYAEGELSDLPESVTEASAGCGNPTAIAGLQPGEVVLDLGSGGGIDCFLAAQKVGPAGRVIGLDMTPEMVKLARRNAKKIGVTNVDFYYGEIEEMPIPDGSVDVIISNCVINLSPDKDAVFGEAFRVLKAGGRVIVSDIVTNGELPDILHHSLGMWASCVSGALDEGLYLDKMRAAGLADVTVTQRVYADATHLLDSDDVQAMLARADPPLSTDWLKGQLADKIASVTVTAHKPTLHPVQDPPEKR